MFFETFIKLCNDNNVKKTNVVKEIGLNPSAVVKWKNGATPNADTIEKLAKYFNVSMEYLMTGEEKQTITKENESEKEIEKMTDDYLNGLFSDETNTLMLNGEPATEEAISFLRNAIRSTVEYAKKMNDEKKQ